MKENLDPESRRGQVIWHPLVHRRFSEELHYFRIRTTNYSSEFRQSLRRTLSEIPTMGFCIYQIFGSYDILLRVWFTSLNRQKFVESAKRFAGIRIEEFLVQEFDVSWNESGNIPETPNESELVQLTPEIVQAAQHGQLTKSEMEDLLSKGLLLSHTISFPNTEYKFFVLMDYSSDVPVGDSLVTQHLKNLIINQSFAEKVSAYSGIGFTRYLIKGVSRDFYNILRFVTELISAFKFLEVHTNTIVVAEEEPCEFDDITLVGSIAAKEADTVRSLVPELYKHPKLKLFELNLLETKILERADAFRNDTDEILQKAIHFIIVDDSRGLAAHVLTYLSEFERFLRESFACFTVGLCREAPQEKNVIPDKVMNDAYKARNVTRNKSLSLGEWIELYRCVSNATLDTKDDWIREHIGTLKAAAAWRNKFAHAEYGNVVQDWSELIDFLSKFILAKKQVETYIGERVSE